MRGIPRSRRLETLKVHFADGFKDFNILLKSAPRIRRVAGLWVCAFVKHSSLRKMAELLFGLYFFLSKKQARVKGAR